MDKSKTRFLYSLRLSSGPGWVISVNTSLRSIPMAPIVKCSKVVLVVLSQLDLGEKGPETRLLCEEYLYIGAIASGLLIARGGPM